MEGFARGIRRLECGLSTGQALEESRRLGPVVCQSPGRKSGVGGPAPVHRLDFDSGASACLRWQKKIDEAEEALGRSRGGYGTKIHLVCTDEDTAVEVVLTPGQAGDAPQFEPLFESAKKRVPGAKEAVGDKGYDSWEIKNKLLDAGMAAHIPSKTNAVEPWPHDEEAYKERNRIERLFNKMKQFRAIATRYDKLADVFLCSVKLVLCFIKVRRIVNRT